ncbi:MAG: squalene/phytoene synthase family protein, partial [Bacteroidales bacterium]|nr:squalene/phytoene synthase family protein [Bacteroidales bacterium]
MEEIFDNICILTSRMTTKKYSTSFSLGIEFLHKKFHDSIYSIYGFVRFADEIVDTFHHYNQIELLNRYKEDAYLAITNEISLNPI